MENVFLILTVLKFKYGTSKTSFCYCGSNMANHVQLTAGIIMREFTQRSCIQDTKNLFINKNNNTITHTHMGVTHLL